MNENQAIRVDLLEKVEQLAVAEGRGFDFVFGRLLIFGAIDRIRDNYHMFFVDTGERPEPPRTFPEYVAAKDRAKVGLPSLKELARERWEAKLAQERAASLAATQQEIAQ